MWIILADLNDTIGTANNPYDVPDTYANIVPGTLRIVLEDGTIIGDLSNNSSDDRVSGLFVLDANGDPTETPNPVLLVSDCVGCHASGGNEKVITFGDPSTGSQVPQVYHTDTLDLAGAFIHPDPTTLSRHEGRAFLPIGAVARFTIRQSADPNSAEVSRVP